MCECTDPFLDDDDIDLLFEDELLDDPIGNNINNNTALNYVLQVRLFPAVGRPTEDPLGGARLPLTDRSKGERGIEEGPCQEVPHRYHTQCIFCWATTRNT